MQLYKRIFVSLLISLSFYNIYSQNVAKGFQLHLQKEYKQAAELFRKSISKKKDIVVCKYGLAQIYSDVNYPKYRYDKAYRYIVYVDKKIAKLTENQKVVYAKKYGLTSTSVNKLKTKILDQAYAQLKQTSNIQDINKFISVYKDSATVKKAIEYRNELLFNDCVKQNDISVCREFLAKYPDAAQADSVRAIIQTISFAQYDEIAQTGELEPLLKFSKENPQFPDKKRLKHDLENAYLADKMAIDEPFSPSMLSVYENYIKAAAPVELAFVALQRILMPYLEKKDWGSAIGVLKKYKTYFADDKRIDKIIEILNRPDEKVKAESISANINTKGHEYAPVITADGKKLYFCGRKREGSIGGEDIFVSKFKNGAWTKPVLINGINTPYGHEAPLAISADGNRLLLYANTDIYYSDKTISGWSRARPFPAVNKEKSWEADAMISSDGNAILFISDRKGNIGHYHPFGKKFHGSYAGNPDIYVSVRTKKGWSKPTNLGTTINTPFAERSPFLHPDMKTLYFSSEGHAGLGMLDVYKTTRLNDSSWTEWSEPVNLGKEINSYNDEYDYKISTDGKKAYMSVVVGDNYNISQIKLPVSMRPEAVATIYGTITNSGGKPQKAKVRWEDLQTGKLIGFSESDITDGTYLIILPLGKNYGYYIDHENYYPVSGNIDLSQQTEQVKIEKNFVLHSYAEIIDKQLSISLENVFFDHNKYQLKPESFSELNRLVVFIKKNVGLKIQISGHTDNVGTEQYNKQLSQKRADAVKKYLVQKGCKSANLSSVGYGESKPVSDNETETGKAKNRRVEFKVVK